MFLTPARKRVAALRSVTEPPVEVTRVIHATGGFASRVRVRTVESPAMEGLRAGAPSRSTPTAALAVADGHRAAARLLD